MNEIGQRWAIVGGGMLGLTLAHRLAQHGRDVTVFEAADRVGGLASAWTVGDVTWDRHYHVTLLSDSHLRNILRELGLDDEIDWRLTRTGMFAKGRLWPITSTTDFLRLPVLSVVDKARLGATILVASKTGSWRKLERLPVSTWLQRWSGRRAYERFWLPLLRAKLGEAYHETSAAFIWATTRRLYAARRSGLDEEKFGYVPGGYARVLERFVEVLGSEGVKVELGTAVRQIAAGPNGGVDVRIGEGSTRFDAAVVTLAPALAARICAGLTAREQELLNGVRYQGIVCASALLDHPLSGYYLTYITDDTPLTGIVEMTSLVDRRHTGGKTLVYLPKYVAPDDPLLKASDEEIETTFLRALRDVYPDVGSDDVTAFRVSRVREVFPIPTIDYSTRLPPQTTSINGLHFVNSAHIVNGTLNVNETVELAERAARRLLGSDTATDVGSGPVKPLAGLSLDLDDRWSYLQTAGHSGASDASYLDVVVPRVLSTLAQHGLRATMFIVGRDAARPENRELIASLVAGHDVGNHSHTHDQRIHTWSEMEIEDELMRAEDAIESATGRRPEGFRGPGYALSPNLLRVLLRRNYAYDASTLPTYLGPLARAFYFRSARLDKAARDDRGDLFGTFADGRRPLAPYLWQLEDGDLLEMPVTTFPIAKVPIHFSYVSHLAGYSRRLADLYVRSALRACMATGVPPSILLHPLDFLGPEDAPDLAFFPGMKTSASAKVALLHHYLSALSDRFDVRPLGEHAREVRRMNRLARRMPDSTAPVHHAVGAAR